MLALPREMNASVAMAQSITPDGRTIVGSSAGAVRWNAQRSLQRIDDILKENTIDTPGFGWLYEALFVSEDGRVIVGRGQYGEELHVSRDWIARF
jgi:uncharacterized membrane protein